MGYFIGKLYVGRYITNNVICGLCGLWSFPSWESQHLRNMNPHVNGLMIIPQCGSIIELLTMAQMNTHEISNSIRSLPAL